PLLMMRVQASIALSAEAFSFLQTPQSSAWAAPATLMAALRRSAKIAWRSIVEASRMANVSLPHGRVRPGRRQQADGRHVNISHNFCRQLGHNSFRMRPRGNAPRIARRRPRTDGRTTEGIDGSQVFRDG